MDALSVNALGPATLGALSALRPVPPVAAPPALDGTASAATLSVQDLAQALFQRALQTAVLSPLAEPSGGSLGLVQETAAPLLAALTAPQAAATPTAAADATTSAITPAITPPAAATETSTTAPPANPPAAVPAEAPATQDAFAQGSSLEFALQTALRFGAGVGAPAAPALAATPGAELVRDAAAVLRTGNLQPHAGGPGPEAFARPQAPLHQVLRSYQVVPAAEASVGLDLTA
ncbi:hypothetical protein GETHOR_26000 [Geothrix oryzae]|uniref:Flagellar hook-length control protein FliK n=1 Tax=Geothrix oryzae TaxID=2927975 RepID=A0ABM8DTV3_9BACT|nr:hypothetical protein [Geothrix oryzae]BDU70499.1 hypothetical protein GETHOR_26000 [Geothrix oryzae]